MSFLPPPTSSHLPPSAYPHTHKNDSLRLRMGRRPLFLWTPWVAGKQTVYYCVATEVTFLLVHFCSYPPACPLETKTEQETCCPAHWVLLSLLTDSQADGCFLCSVVYQTLTTLPNRSPKSLNVRQVRSKQVLALKLTRRAPENELLYSLTPVVSLTQERKRCEPCKVVPRLSAKSSRVGGMPDIQGELISTL